MDIHDLLSLLLIRSKAGPQALLKHDQEGIAFSLPDKPCMTHSIIVTLTKGLLFSMLEVGMSLVAVNLPSLSFLMSKKAHGFWLHSIRSVFSLYSSVPSNGPSTSNDASHSASKSDVKDSFSTSSRSNLPRHTDRDMYERFEMQGQGVFDMEKGS